MKVNLYIQSYGRMFFALLAGLTLALSSVPFVFAASTYAVLPATGTVGTAIPSLELEYTVDTAVQTWADTDTLVINLPPNIGPTGWGGLTYTVEFDEDTTNDGIGEVLLVNENIDNRGEFGASGPNLTIDWDQTTWVADNTDTIRVLITSVTPRYANSTTNFLYSGVTAAASPAIDTDPSGTATINVSAAVDAAAAITLGTAATVGTAGTTTITLTTPFVLAATDTIDIDFPAYVDISGAAEVAGGTFGNDAGASVVTCDDAGQVLTCTVSVASTTVTTGTITLAGITTRYAGSTDITSFEVEAGGVAANDIVVETTVVLDNVSAADAAATVVFGLNSTVAVAGTTTVEFTIPKALASSDTVDITFPSNIDVSSVAFSSDTFGGAGSFTCSDSAQVVTCTADGAITMGTGSLLLSGILITAAGTTDVTGVEVENAGVASDDIATDTSVTTTDVVAAEAASSGGSGGGTHGGSGGGSSSSSGDDDDDDDSTSTSGDSEKPFSDLRSSSNYYDEIVDLVDRGVIGGYPDGTIKEENGMNRAELMKIVVLAVTTEPDATVYNNCYTDVTDQWFAPYVCYATEQGWIEGYADGSFAPGGTANNAEVLKMILNTNGIEVDAAAEGEEWYSPYVNEGEALGLFTEGSFVSGHTTSRGYAFYLLSSLLGML